MGLIWTLTCYQMTCPVTENGFSFVEMKLPIGYLGGGLIVAVMFLAVFVGGANAGNFTRGQSQSNEALATKGHH